MPVWRSLPIPVADRLYRPVRRMDRAHATPRMLFVGRSTVHRERFLLDVKHRFDCLHVAFGIQVDELERLLDRHHITFNIHNEPYPSFENRVLLHLAAGHLVISEPLSPTHGLEPGFDYVEVDTPEDAARRRRRAPTPYLDTFHRVRVRGRQKAEHGARVARLAGAGARPRARPRRLRHPPRRGGGPGAQRRSICSTRPAARCLSARPRETSRRTATTAFQARWS